MADTFNHDDYSQWSVSEPRTSHQCSGCKRSALNDVDPISEALCDYRYTYSQESLCTVLRSAEPLIRELIRRQFWNLRHPLCTEDDVLTDVFDRLLRASRTFDCQQGIEPLIKSIVRSSGIDFYRKMRTRTNSLTVSMPYTEEELPAVEASTSSDPVWTARFNDAIKRLPHVLAKLPSQDREIIIMRRRGATFLEISVALKIPFGTVKGKYDKIVERIRGLVGL